MFLPAYKPSNNELSGAQWYPSLFAGNTAIFIARGLGAFMHGILIYTYSQ